MNSQNVYEENLKYWTERVPGYSEVNQLELATVQAKVEELFAERN